MTQTERTTDIPTVILDIFARDSRIMTVRDYAQGWVANKYHWPAPGDGIEYTRMESGTPDEWITDEPISYDRKRSFGRGPRYVAYSAKGGPVTGGREELPREPGLRGGRR